MAFPRVQIRTQAEACLPKKVVVDGHDLSDYCRKVETRHEVGDVPIIVLHIHGIPEITHEFYDQQNEEVE
jgi:hypothetical protein